MEIITKNVLLVDDDKVTNFFNKRVVSKIDYFKEITTVTSGKMALDFLEDVKKGIYKKPDIIFLDLNMPAMNGWEFLDEFIKLDCKFTKSIKVVILTTSNSPDDYNRSLKIKRVNGFINKPLSQDILLNLINTKFDFKIEYE